MEGNMRSQELRKQAPELDPLRLGTGWKREDLAKPQILIESSFGDSHPGSVHLLELAEKAKEGAAREGGFGARYFCTDICDGEAQGHDGMYYSLPSRDMMANMIEIHACATPFDGAVYIAGCDKSMPAHLMAAGRINIPCVVLPGGVMNAGPDLLTLEQIGAYSAMYERGEISEEQFRFYQTHACPSCGSCSFMGTASTMQIMAEALGLALPGTALLPAAENGLREAADAAGRQAVRLARMGLAPSDIVTEASFENAVMVHAAISGSTNSLLHLPAIAHEFGIRLDADSFDRLHRGAHYLLNIRPAGKWPAQFFSYAGGVPAVMEEIRSMLHLDVMTVTGKTLGENLEELRKNGFYEERQKRLADYGLKKEDVIRPFDHPFGTNGSVAVLKGNLAPDGAVVKHTVVPKEMFSAVLTARPFDCEEDALNAVLTHKIQPGDAVIIRYEGPKGSGMPEMFYTTEAIASDPLLASTIALLTDGRFSGASKGPAVGHISPEAAEGGPIALVEEGDLIELDIEKRILRLIGVKGQRMEESQITEILRRRKAAWTPPKNRYEKGALKHFASLAVSPMKGGYMDS